MALTGLQIQKLLPQTNCKECGSNTCLAFAMKLASKKAGIAQCPYASEEAKQTLGMANEPPVKTVALGPDRKLVAGGEIVLYRHDKTFINKTIIAVNINDTDAPDKIDQTLQAVKSYVLERVGETIGVDMVGVTQLSSDNKGFTALAQEAWQITGKPLILRSSRTDALLTTAAVIEGSHSVICAPTMESVQKLLPIVRQHEHALAISAPDMDTLIESAQSIRALGFTNLFLQLAAPTIADQLQINTVTRRAAIKDNYKPLGFPFLHFIDSGNLLTDTSRAITEITRYGGICVLPAFDAAQLATLFTLRLNIFTDPQKPIQVEPKIYPIGEPASDSAVFVTTNFSLTYFIVCGEIENSGISAWLVVPECEGMSVLTAWAAGKFSATMIASFIKASKLEEQISTRKIVIPGYVSQISGELEDKLPGWTVLVGPEEASDLESFIKANLP
jgi:acetyl-CoA decarbonylase/synthase complex subunit gamma